MKLLSRVSLSATLKTFRRHIFRNGVSPPTLNPYKVMIRGFAAAWNSESESAMVAASWKAMEEAPWLFKPMVENGVDDDDPNEAIQELCGEGRTIEAQEMLEEMNQKGFVADESTYMSLFDLFCFQSQYDEAYNLLNEMVLASGSPPWIDPYNKLIHRLCYKKKVEEALWILRDMAEMGLSPDAVSYNTVIFGFCQIEELGKAYELKVEMVEKGFLLDDNTYSWLLPGLCTHRRLLEALDLFRERLRGGELPDKYSYASLMNAYYAEGEFSKAFHLHNEMIHNGFLLDFVTGFSPSLVTYNALIHGLCSLGRAEEALVILRGMAEVDLSPDTVSYSNVISGFCRNRELRKAYDLKEEMAKKDLYGVDGFVFSSLMQGLLDEAAYTSLINDYCAEGRVDKALALLDEMADNGYLPESLVCLLMDLINRS